MEEINYVIKENVIWAEMIERALLKMANDNTKSFLGETEEGLRCYSVSEILFCPTYYIYKRKNFIPIKSFHGIKLQISKLSISNYIMDLLDEIDNTSENNIILDYNLLNNDYFIRFKTDYILNNSILHIKTIESLSQISFSNIYLQYYDSETNEIDTGYGKFPRFKPRNHDVNQFIYNISLLNYISKYSDIVNCLYIPLETKYNYKEQKYFDRIFLFRFNINMDLQDRCLQKINEDIHKYNSVEAYLEPNQIPNWSDLERIPSRICLYAKNRGGCKLKKYVSKEKKQTFLCATTPEEKSYIQENIKRPFPLFFPTFTEEEISIYKSEIYELFIKYLELSEYKIFLPEGLRLLFIDNIDHIFNKYFGDTKWNVPINVICSRIISAISVTVNEMIEKSIAEKIDTLINGTEFKGLINTYLDDRIKNHIFTIDQDEELRFKIVSRMYNKIFNSYFYDPSSFRMIGECPRYLNLLTYGNLYNMIREYYLDSIEDLKVIPPVITNELRINIINQSLLLYYKEYITTGIYEELSYKNYTFEYFISDYKKIGFDKYPILFFFTPSLYNLDKLLDNENKIPKYTESTGSRKGRQQRYYYPKRQWIPTEVVIPRTKDIFQTIILQNELRKQGINKKPILMIYLPRDSSGDIRIFTVSTKNSIETDNIIEEFNKRVECSEPYTEKEFLNNELRCIYCPYSYLEGEESGIPICKEGKDLRDIFIKKY